MFLRGGGSGASLLWESERAPDFTSRRRRSLRNRLKQYSRLNIRETTVFERRVFDLLAAYFPRRNTYDSQHCAVW